MAVFKNSLLGGVLLFAFLIFSANIDRLPIGQEEKGMVKKNLEPEHGRWCKNSGIDLEPAGDEGTGQRWMDGGHFLASYAQIRGYRQRERLFLWVQSML